MLGKCAVGKVDIDDGVPSVLKRVNTKVVKYGAYYLTNPIAAVPHRRATVQTNDLASRTIGDCIQGRDEDVLIPELLDTLGHGMGGHESGNERADRYRKSHSGNHTVCLRHLP